jgi:hypothetical protein
MRNPVRKAGLGEPDRGRDRIDLTAAMNAVMNAVMITVRIAVSGAGHCRSDGFVVNTLSAQTLRLSTQ